MLLHCEFSNVLGKNFKKSFVNHNLFADYILEVDLSSREVVKQGVERQGAACNRT